MFVHVRAAGVPGVPNPAGQICQLQVGGASAASLVPERLVAEQLPTPPVLGALLPRLS